MNKKTLNRWVFIVIIAVLAILTWFKNEQKFMPKPLQTDDFRHYDSIMAQDRFGQNNVPTDYFMLALSWSPEFCQEQRERNGGKVPAANRYQCESGQFGWVIHGLWPQSAKAMSVEQQPRFCQGDLPPLAIETFKPYLNASPSNTLLQGQWEKHGACAFPTADAYFAQQQSLFDNLRLPSEPLNRKALFQWMKEHNPSLRQLFLGAAKNELYICYNKHWQPINCPK